jgi:hypothetical protein
MRKSLGIKDFGFFFGFFFGIFFLDFLGGFKKKLYLKHFWGNFLDFFPENAERSEAFGEYLII